MITTKDVNVKMDISPKKLNIKTTREIDAALPYSKNPKPKPRREMITTHNIEDVIKAANAESMRVTRAAKKAKALEKKRRARG